MLEPRIYALIPLALLLATGGALSLSWYAWKRRPQPGAGWFAFTVFTSSVWTAMDLFNYLADLPWVESILKRSTWMLILVAGFGFFRFACIHARRERWWERARVPISAAMAINLLLMLSNERHLLLWPGERWVDFGAGRVPWLESGPAFFWVFRPTACALPAAGALALAASAIGASKFYLWQIAVLVVGATVPIVVNMLFISTAVPGFDATPVSVVVAIGAFGWATLRFRLLQVKSVAWGLLLEQLDDGIVVLDPQGRVVDLNPAAQRLLDSKSWAPGVAIEQLAPFWSRVEANLSEGGVPNVEAELASSPGTVLELSSTSIHGDEGADAGRIVVLHDVSARAAVIRDLDAYAQTVAADLKHPLGELLLSIQAFPGECLSDESSGYLHDAERVCRQMNGTVDALLCFAKLRSLAEVETEVLDMSAIVDATQRRLSAAIANAKAEIVIPQHWPAVIGHPIWIEEIWTNYISNAIKYGGCPPHVQLGASADAHSNVRFWVRDDGPGLDEAQRACLFTEFTRLEPMRSEGHGLGLSIVQRIAHKLGGEVGCDSTPGQGCTFWFTLASSSAAVRLAPGEPSTNNS